MLSGGVRGRLGQLTAGRRRSRRSFAGFRQNLARRAERPRRWGQPVGVGTRVDRSAPRRHDRVGGRPGTHSPGRPAMVIGRPQRTDEQQINRMLRFHPHRRPSRSSSWLSPARWGASMQAPGDVSGEGSCRRVNAVQGAVAAPVTPPGPVPGRLVPDHWHDAPMLRPESRTRRRRTAHRLAPRGTLRAGSVPPGGWCVHNGLRKSLSPTPPPAPPRAPGSGRGHRHRSPWAPRSLRASGRGCTRSTDRRPPAAASRCRCA